MRAKYIKEKFNDDADPIHDMGIGVASIREFETVEEAAETFVDNINILTKGIFKSSYDVMKYIVKRDMQGLKEGDPSILSECKTFLDGSKLGKPPLLIHELGGRFDRVTQRLQFLRDFKIAVERLVLKPSRPKLQEKFVQDSDPIKDMGIGMVAIRKRFIKELNAFKKELKRQGDPFEQRGKNDGFDFIETELNKDETTLNLKVIVKHLKKELKGWDEVLPYLDRAEHVPGIKSGLQTVLGFVENFKREYLLESFKEESDPIKDMGIGMDHYIYNIEKEGYDSYNFNTNNEKIAKFIKKCIPEISENEIERFMAFTLSDIYDNIDADYFELNDLDRLDQQIAAAIKQESRNWMSMHSDKAMKSFMR